MKRHVAERFSILVIIVFYTLLTALIWFSNSALAPKHQGVPSTMRPSMSEREQVALAVGKHHWNYRQFECLAQLLDVENPTWNPRDLNPESGASGVFQVMPSPSGHLFRNYALKDQARLGTKYIAVRYGTPCKALRHEFRYGWY